MVNPTCKCRGQQQPEATMCVPFICCHACMIREGAFVEEINGKELSFLWGCDGMPGSSCWEVRGVWGGTHSRQNATYAVVAHYYRLLCLLPLIEAYLNPIQSGFAAWACHVPHVLASCSEKPLLLICYCCRILEETLLLDASLASFVWAHMHFGCLRVRLMCTLKT